MRESGTPGCVKQEVTRRSWCKVGKPTAPTQGRGASGVGGAVGATALLLRSFHPLPGRYCAWNIAAYHVQNLKKLSRRGLCSTTLCTTGSKPL